MIEPALIDKNRKLLPSQDYDFLREQGMDYVRSLSGRIWTDHNRHDPGITTLEILCYALTDLGYRAAFGIPDLLARADGKTDAARESGLFPAHEVLTCSPLTINDYRRLLLMVEGVRNAWLDPMTDPSQENNYRESEVPIYADCLKGQLSYAEQNAGGTSNLPVRLSGLYRVLLELEIDDVLGSLNESRLVFTVRSGPLKGVVVSLDSSDTNFVHGNIDFGKDISAIVSVMSLVPQGKQHFDAQVRVKTDDAEFVLDQLVLRVVNDRPIATADPVTVNVARLTELLLESTPDSLIPMFWRKQRKKRESIDTVHCVLHAHRNLCEDFLSIRSVGADRVAVCADIEASNAVDLEELQARVFLAIENYFNPPIRYFTIQELLEEGLCSDAIFNGPFVDLSLQCHGRNAFTKPGFVKESDLEASSLRRELHVSDIINILMDLDGVVAVRNVMLRKYDTEGNATGSGEKWCLEIAPQHQPVLAIENSKIVFFKDQLPFRARPGEFQQTLDYLRAMQRKAAYVERNQTLSLPVGNYRSLEEFFSIQNDFPKTYGIGREGLATNVPPERIAQARQFKAYLTFFDQMMADFLGQLANFRHLFSLDGNLAQTYFFRFIRDVPGVQSAFEDEFYISKTALQKNETQNRISEDEELFFERRSRLLDHFAARFGEEFTNYVMLMFSLDGDKLKTGQSLIEDKIQFLREYPVVSRQRHQAFNRFGDVWDTENVSGLEKRVARLAGIADYRRRDLACTALFDELFTTSQENGQFRLQIGGASGSTLFRSKEVFPNKAAALNEARKLYPLLRREKSYDVDASGGTGQVFYRISAGGATLRHDALFDTEADAVASIRAIIDRYDEVLTGSGSCNEEGFHLIEHLLLRPSSDTDELMEVCLAPNCESCGDEDPYSFRVHVVLPYWPRRFQNLNFRRFFERMLREETPAHVQVRICWVSNEQMADLDHAYRAWLEAQQHPAGNPATRQTAARELIHTLQRMRTVYPAATLHDCVEGGDENPVRLDNTNLGIF